MIVALADIKVYLGLTEEVAVLSLLHPRIERAVKEYVGYGIEQTTYTHYLPAVGTTAPGDSLTDDDMGALYGFPEDRRCLFLPELPVRSITTVHVNTQGYGVAANFTSDHLLTDGTHYWMDYEEAGLSRTGILRRINSNWPLQARSVKVTYSAGWTAEELLNTDIPLAVMVTAAAMFQEAGAMQGSSVGEGFGPVTMEGDGPWNTTYDATSIRELAGLQVSLPRKAKELLHRYRRLDVALV